MAHERLAQLLTQIYATAEVEIDCDRLQALLPVFVELELAAAEVSANENQPLHQDLCALRDHLAQCPDCAEEYAGLRIVVDLESQGRLPAVDELLGRFEDAGEPVRPEAVCVVKS